MPSKHGNSRESSSALLRSKLRQLKRVNAADLSIQSDPSTIATEPTWVTEEEEATLSPDQLEFLTRKRRAAAGLGPIMPETSRCASCAGEGMVECHSCAGSGLNPVGLAEEMFDGKPVVVNNGVVDPRWMFIDNGPCWLCKGTTLIGCKDCGGVGIVGIMEKYNGD